MAEYRLQESLYPSTEEYHINRERVPHLEQSWHAGRLYMAAKLVRKAEPTTVCDLGCGDGGLLSVLQGYGIRCWGYDFQPSNGEGWDERGVDGRLEDVFNTEFEPEWGDLVVMTEVLEHLANPHLTVEWVANHARYLVASSPKDELPGDHACDSHIWSWDWEGYEALINPHFEILDHKAADWSQIILGRSRYI